LRPGIIDAWARRRAAVRRLRNTGLYVSRNYEKGISNVGGISGYLSVPYG